MSDLPTDAIKEYLRVLAASLKQGNATEHTHRPALEALLEALGGSGVDAINEPSRIAPAPVWATLARTLELQTALDATIVAAGGWPLNQ